MENEYNVYVDGLHLIENNITIDKAIEAAHRYKKEGMVVHVEDAWTCDTLEWDYN